KSLAKYTSWRTGGCGDTVYLPADRDDLAAFLRQLPPGEALTPLGLGSNTLVRDGGVRGTVVILHDPGAVLAIADGLIYVDAGVACPKLARFAALHASAGAELLARRIATQPLGVPNAGSVFRNPDGDHAARLIESCGLKGHAIGGARVSEMHANFIVNPAGMASGADIEALIIHVRSTVREKTG